MPRATPISDKIIFMEIPPRLAARWPVPRRRAHWQKFKQIQARLLMGVGAPASRHTAMRS